MDLSTYLTKTRRAQSEFARAIGVSPSMLYQWLNGIRPIAHKHGPKIEQETAGQCPREELFNDWQDYWPELARGSRRRRPSNAAPETT